MDKKDVVTIICPICGKRIEIVGYNAVTRSDALGAHLKKEHSGPSLLPQTSRDPVIEKGRQYWSKVNATQKAILDRMNAGTILEVHSDGDLTFEAEGRKYVLTTGGELFVGTPEYHPDHKGILPRTAPSAHQDLKYYKVPPSAF